MHTTENTIVLDGDVPSLKIEPTQTAEEKLKELVENLNMSPVSQSNETHEEYKSRMKLVSKVSKFKLQPTVFWDSSRQGTYRKQ